MRSTRRAGCAAAATAATITIAELSATAGVDHGREAIRLRGQEELARNGDDEPLACQRGLFIRLSLGRPGARGPAFIDGSFSPPQSRTRAMCAIVTDPARSVARHASPQWPRSFTSIEMVRLQPIAGAASGGELPAFETVARAPPLPPTLSVIPGAVASLGPHRWVRSLDFGAIRTRDLVAFAGRQEQVRL